jgi:serine/threonine protein kinase
LSFGSSVLHGPLPEPQVKHFFQQIVRGVHMLHYLGCAHRDLSLDNILVTKTDPEEIRIIDFGMVFIREHGLSSFKVPNTISVGKYMFKSPEAEVSQEYDAALNDVWSCGVILFCLLVGVPPFQCPRTTDANFRLIMAGEIDQLIRVSVEADLVLSEAAKGKLHLILEPRLHSNVDSDLILRIFKPEDQRISTKEILQHPFFESL